MKLLCLIISIFCALEVPVTTIVSFQFLRLNPAVPVDEVSHSHLLCFSEDTFCGKSHYFLPILLLSVKQKQIRTKLILPKKCEASYIYTIHFILWFQLFSDNGGHSK